MLIIAGVFFRACLQLITDCPPAIQEELDLINALSQLEDFSVCILPLQGDTPFAFPLNILRCKPSKMLTFLPSCIILPYAASISASVFTCMVIYGAGVDSLIRIKVLYLWENSLCVFKMPASDVILINLYFPLHQLF